MWRHATTALLTASVLLGGCTSAPHDVRIDADVNALPPGTTPPQSYWIKTRQSSATVESLRYKEAVGHIKTALSGQGLFEAPNEQNADMVVELEYGVRSRRQRFDVDESRPEKTAARKPREETDPAEEGTTVDERGTGRREVELDTDFYEKRLSIEARSRRKSDDDPTPELLWRVTAKNTDHNNDLRKFVPILAAATIDYIGKDTGGEKRIKVDDDGTDLAFVKKGL